MLDATPSSDNSPISSPFQSPITSPNSSRGPSRGPSPVPSPKIQLRRANSYRNGKKGTSKLDDFIKRRKLLRRNRSQSDTDIDGEEETQEEEENMKVRRKKKSISQDLTEKCKIKSESDFYSTTPDTPDRKKSLSQILDFRRIIELSPKLPRSHSKASLHSKKSKIFTVGDEERDKYEGPLFQATTMFVPGYDFKTKQTTKDRAASKSFLSRRGSRDKSLISLLEKVQSSPNLLRRGSKDKLDKHAVENIKSKSKYTRCDSSPQPIILKDKSLDSLTQREVYSDDNLAEYLSISERSAIIAQRQRKFANMKKSKYTAPEVPEKVIGRGSVKKISITFEDGSIYEKNLTQRRQEFANIKKRYSGEYDNVFRERANSFDNGEIFRKRSYTSYDHYSSDQYGSDINKNGSESGYASPTESMASEASAQTQPDLTKHNPLINVIASEDTEELSNSWSHGQWKSKREKSIPRYLSPDIVRVISTDLCVTEL